MADRLARKQGLSRRRFFQTASGMAASFAALNEVFGMLFDATPAEAQTPEMADARAKALSSQFIMDTHTHFLRDDTRLTNFVAMRAAVGKAGWNKSIGDKPQTIDDLKYENYFKEIYLDSDTKVAFCFSRTSARSFSPFVQAPRLPFTPTDSNHRCHKMRAASSGTATP